MSSQDDAVTRATAPAAAPGPAPGGAPAEITRATLPAWQTSVKQGLSAMD